MNNTNFTSAQRLENNESSEHYSDDRKKLVKHSDEVFSKVPSRMSGARWSELPTVVD